MRLVLSLVLLLAAGAVAAESQIKHKPLRQKQADVFQESAPRPVQIRLLHGIGQQEYINQIMFLGTSKHQLGAGVAGSVIAGILRARRAARHENNLITLDQYVSAEQLIAQLDDATKVHLSDSALLQPDAVEIIHLQPETVFSEAPQNGLILTIGYRFTEFFRELNVILDAEVVGLSKFGKPTHAYYQRIYFSTQAPRVKGLRKMDERYMAYWLANDGAAFREALEQAPNALMEMLAYDMPLAVRHGRRDGEQIGFLDPPFHSVGVAVEDRGSRHWVRLRNGYLVSLGKHHQ